MSDAMHVDLSIVVRTLASYSPEFRDKADAAFERIRRRAERTTVYASLGSCLDVIEDEDVFRLRYLVFTDSVVVLDIKIENAPSPIRTEAFLVLRGSTVIGIPYSAAGDNPSACAIVGDPKVVLYIGDDMIDAGCVTGRLDMVLPTIAEGKAAVQRNRSKYIALDIDTADISRGGTGSDAGPVAPSLRRRRHAPAMCVSVLARSHEARFTTALPSSLSSGPARQVVVAVAVAPTPASALVEDSPFLLADLITKICIVGGLQDHRRPATGWVVRYDELV